MQKIIGIVLVVAGIAMFVYTGFNFVTTEKIVDLGPIKINQETNHPIQWSPIIGVIILVGGIVIIVLDRKNKS